MRSEGRLYFDAAAAVSREAQAARSGPRSSREPRRPVVVEVAADAAWSGKSFRHALRFPSTRPELTRPLVAEPKVNLLDLFLGLSDIEA